MSAAEMPGSPMEEQMIALALLGRAELPEDMPLPVTFLASDEARFVAGAILPITGGAGL